MDARNQNWYNLQETRRYPLDDSATGEDDTGRNMPDNILVDCHIRFPGTVGTLLYIQGLTVSEGIVTVVFGAATNVYARNNPTIAALSLPKPVTVGINYAVSGLLPGAAGWVTFGSGIREPVRLVFSTAAQSLIARRNGRSFRALPIQSLKKLGLKDAITGEVTLTVTDPLAAEYKKDAGEIKDTNEQAQRAIVIGLNKALISETTNVLKDFASTCAQRPESNTCGQQPIEAINGIKPDCDGNVNIIFDGLTAYNFKDCGGLDIVTGVGLQETCANIPDPKKEFKDICCGEITEEGVVLDEFCWPDPAPEIIVTDIVNQNYTCKALPVQVCLNSCEATAEFVLAAGSFLSTVTDAPPPNAKTYTPDDLSAHYVLASVPNAGSVAVLKNCPTDWSINKKITTTLKLTPTGIEKAGGIVLNYNSFVSAGRLRREYIAVVIDGDNGLIKVLRYADATFTIEHEAPYPVNIDDWYSLAIIPAPNGDGATLNIVATNLFTGTTTNLTVVVPNYGTITGNIGLFAQRSYVYFNSFEVTA